MNKVLEKEACDAYSDCNGFSIEESDLDWNSKCFISVSEAIQIMELAVEYGYNAFDASLLRYLSECIDQEVNVCLAREGSVCVYIRVGKELAPAKIKKLSEKLNCDEFYECLDAEEYTYRIWWD